MLTVECRQSDEDSTFNSSTVNSNPKSICEMPKISYIIYNKFMSMSFSINSIIAEGKKIEDLEDSDEIIIPVFEVNADERFEIR